jgi:PAS domain S-box-containing protein
VIRLTVLFVAIVCLPIAALAGRSYLARGDPGLLWLSGGAVVWAFAGLVAAALAPRDINAAVTAHNLLAWTSAACHLIGAFVLPRPQAHASGSPLRLGLVTGAACAVVALVALATGHDVLPRFFTPGVGGTPLRYAVLGSAALMFMFSAALLIRDRGHGADSFSYWYSIGLIIIAIGLSAIMLQTDPRNPMAWVGRVAQVVGTAYMLAAVVVATRSARAMGLPVAIALHEAEQRFDDLIEMAGDGIVLADLGSGPATGRIIRANPAACALLGYPAEELARMSPEDVVAPEERDQLPADAAQLARDGRLTCERTFVARDGHRLAVAINARLVRFDGTDRVVAILHDVSERRRNDEERAHLAAIVQQSNDAIVAATLDGAITHWNRGAAQLFGYEAAAVVGRPVVTIFPLDPLHANEPVRESPEPSRPHRDLDTVGMHRDGTRIPLSVTTSPIRDRAGRAIGISMIARDVSEKRQSEELLARAKAAAEEASRAKSTFIANMSHEIRTPLQNIVGLSELLRRDAVAPAQRQRAESLCATADHMMSVVNDILELSRIEADRVVLEHRDFAIAETLDSAVAVIREPARAKGLRIAVELPVALRDVVLRGDRLRLRQVLINLLSNAVKFTAKGSVTVSVDRLGGAAPVPTFRFAVTDTGIGIGPGDRSRIFKAFEQVGGATARTQGGSGLGLAICEGLVHAMGGHIDVTSKPGHGSTFAFELPLAYGSGVPEPTAAAPASDGYFAGSHVLVADDNGLSRELLKEMLVDLGCAVDVAQDGHEAVAKARAVVYDLVLLDIQMPGLDGLGAARAIRALPEHGHTPILALTANALVDDREHAIDGAMNAWLRKPVTGAMLRAELGNWLAHSPDLGTPADAAVDAAVGVESTVARGTEVGGMLAFGAAGGRRREALLRDYVALHGTDVAQLRAHVLAGRHAAARRVLHNLEGSAAMIGARGLELAAAALSAELRNGAGPDTLESLTRACEAKFEQLASSASVE